MAGNFPSAAEWIAQSKELRTRRGHRVSFRRRGAGPTVLMLHGFPTWSYDYAAVATDLARDHDVITVDFLGYGASDKPAPYDYSVAESADIVEDLLAHLRLASAYLVVHDYGGIVGQELVDRQRGGHLPFTVDGLTVLNCGIVYSAYRPTRLQQVLNTPLLGKLVATRVTAATLRKGLAAVWGETKPTDAEFAELWHGVSLRDGHKLAHLLIRYNRERARHHARWEAAFATWDGPLHLVWGLSDPVSGQHVLREATRRLPHARVTELDGVGHFPQSEAAADVAAAIRADVRST